MGLCGSKDEKYQVRESRKIDESLRRQQNLNMRTIKLLLLGAGESGKSTILKQMKILHKEGFTRQEFEMVRPVVYSNTLHALLAILRAMNYFDIAFDESNRQRDAQLLYSTMTEQRDSEPYSEELSAAMKRIWKDQGVQDCFKRNNEFQIDDSAKYFLDQLNVLAQHDYFPTKDHLLRTRIKTTGITEVLFELKDMHFRVIDVGGQRSERKKWIHCFDSVNAIIFISSLSEYDQTLREDNRTNRMQESLKLFDSICNSPWFTDTHFILFLNKTDLFADKILRNPLVLAFPEYDGGQNYSECINYIQYQFEQLNRNTSREVYCHHTCATDTTNVQFVLDACLDMIIAKNLKNMGLV